MGPTLELIMNKYLLKTSEGLAGRILEMAGETTGVICVALDVEVAGAAVAVSRRGKAPRYFGKSGREEILGTIKSLADLGNQVVCVHTPARGPSTMNSGHLTDSFADGSD